MPGKKEDKTTFVSEQWGLQLADLEFTGDLFMKGRFYEKIVNALFQNISPDEC